MRSQERYDFEHRVRRATRTRTAVLVASLAAALVVAAAAAAQPSRVATNLPTSSTKATEGMPPDVLRSYVKVRTRLIIQVDAFMRTYRSCARRKGYLNRAWSECVRPAMSTKYIPAMSAMFKVLLRAWAGTDSADPCFRPILRYSSTLVRARQDVLNLVHYTSREGSRYISFSQRKARQYARKFVISRNRATNARLRVNRVCGAPPERRP